MQYREDEHPARHAATGPCRHTSHPCTHLLLAGMEYLARKRGRGLAPPGTPPAPAAPLRSQSRSQRGRRRRGPPTRTCRCSRERSHPLPGRSARWRRSRWGSPAWPAAEHCGGQSRGSAQHCSNYLVNIAAQLSTAHYSTNKPPSPPLPPAAQRRRS